MFGEVDPAEAEFYLQAWHQDMNHYAWLASQSGGGYCSLYLPAGAAKKLKEISYLADDHVYMVLPLLDYLQRGARQDPESS